MKICEICGAEEQQAEASDDTEMIVLGVCETCRNTYNQSHYHQSLYPEG